MEIQTVGTVVAYLKLTIERDPLLADVWVDGELSNVTRSAAGHVYFTLKDSAASLRCVQFRGRTRTAGTQSSANGDHVVVHGRLSVYEPRGDVQLIADTVQPAGVGLLQLQFEQLKAKLEAEGLFDEHRKRPLHRFPSRIGLVTSPTGAVLHDILNVMGRRYPLAELVFAPTSVQGEDAPGEICRAIDQLNDVDDLDLVIVARGGGSIEDLWAFNDETVARAIFASRYPVVSAVGHETDWTIADYVADLRAPTPSAAAELVTPDVADLRARIDQMRATLQSTTTARINALRSDVRLASARLKRAVPDPSDLRQRLDDLGRRLVDRTTGIVAVERARLEGIASRVTALSPVQTLARGYAVVENLSQARPVRSLASVRSGDSVRVRVTDGRFSANVEQVEGSPQPDEFRNNRAQSVEKTEHD